MAYHNHHWRRLLSLLGRLFATLIRTLNWGFPAESPFEVIQALNTFNENMLQFKKGRPRNEKLEINLRFFDIKEFFTHVTQSELKR